VLPKPAVGTAPARRAPWKKNRLERFCIIGVL
jgi:hypothetical protein